MFSGGLICGPEEKPQPFWNGFSPPDPQNRSGFQERKAGDVVGFFFKTELMSSDYF